MLLSETDTLPNCFVSLNQKYVTKGYVFNDPLQSIDY